MAKIIITNLDTLIDVKVTENVNVITANATSVNATAKAEEAATSAGIAKSHEIAAGVNAGIATTKANNASVSASVSTTQAEIATTQAGLATTAKNSTDLLYTASLEVLAQTNKIYDDFDDRYLRGHSSNPIVNNDGDAILDGALYWNTTSKEIKVYSQTSNTWIALKDIGSGALLTVNNLADIANAVTARTNLDVYSKVETNTAVSTAVNGLIDTAPATLDTLNELAAALANDPNFATTLSTVIGTKVTANTTITGATKTKITYDSKGLVTNGSDLIESDIPALSISKTTGLQTVLDGKVDDGQVLTNVPLGALFTDTTYTDAEIKTKYENNLDTNAYTDAEQLKLSGIAVGATVNSTDAVLLARTNHTGTQSLTTVTPDNVIGTPIDIDNMTKLFNHSNSSGVMHGCALTNNGDGSVNIASGYAMIRASADAHSTLYKIEVPAHTNFVLLEGLNYISLNWNAGTPLFTTSSSELSFNCLDVCIAYVAVREGTTISYTTATEQNVDSNRKTRRLFLQFSRFLHLGSGSSLGNAGALAVSVTAGKFNFMLEELSHTAFDTSVVGTATANVFDMYYRDGIGGWTKTVNQKVVNTITYDNGTGTLTTLGNNKFGVTWFYMILNNPNHLVAIIGEVEYADSASADAATPPTAVPTMVEGLGVLLGYVTYQKSATEISKVFSAFTKTFNSSQAVTHNGLSGIQGGAVSDYQHLTTAQVSAVATIESRVVSNTAITAGTGTKVTYDAKGLVTGSTTLSATDIPVLDASKITTGTLAVLNGGTGVTTSTGTGNVVLSSSPTLVTPVLGVATGTSFNSITGLASVVSPMDGVAAVGTSTTSARQDHVHASDTTKVDNSVVVTSAVTSVTFNVDGSITIVTP